MAGFEQIIELYSTLVEKPQTDFGWAKGLENAKAHNYTQEWFDTLPSEIWQYCAAVGNPFKLGHIDKGLTVVDLGCGAGVDLLISAYLVGVEGKAIGVDITPKMVDKAKSHALLGGFTNVEVFQSSFDTIDVEDASIDIVISNGAINLTSCKESVFAEIYRILKNDGKIYFADMIDISEETYCSNTEATSCCASEKEDWANCVTGTLKKEKLIDIIKDAGFKDVKCVAVNHYTTADTTRGATFKATKMSMKERRHKHWENIYKTKDTTKVFWHQTSPMKSLKLIEKYSYSNASVIDVGCGTSLLVDELLQNNYVDISLLDTAQSSLDIIKKRIPKKNVNYICEDILDFKSDSKFDIWHDRAVFHFLLTKEERIRYLEVLKDSLKDDGIAIISTFKIDGPISCAGLDIVQYDHISMASELTNELELIESEEYIHITPSQNEQKYIYFMIKKK